MVLRPGTRFGIYEIQSALGAGGMGEVYRARDTRLGRDVAIKVLPAAFTDNPDRLARFGARSARPCDTQSSSDSGYLRARTRRQLSGAGPGAGRRRDAGHA